MLCQRVCEARVQHMAAVMRERKKGRVGVVSRGASESM